MSSASPVAVTQPVRTSSGICGGVTIYSGSAPTLEATTGLPTACACATTRPRTGASVIALTRGGVTESNPSHKIQLEVGDVVVLLGTREQIRRAIGLLADTKTD